ncbi:MAG: long-chain fatty acid--CoA ligase, partial [Calditrichaeota bacterium]
LILEGIGMTENTSFTNVNRYDNYKFGTVGPPGPGIEQKVAPDGEVLYRGKNVMKGYYKNPDATAEAIDKDGWLYTGDVGEIDEDNFLRITDRKKDLIITAGGKNIAPQFVERTIKTSRYISQCMAYGDRKKYLVALITLDQPQVEQWATEQGIQYNSWEELAQHPKVRELIAREVEEKNKQLASFETIKKFIIVTQDFSIDGGELTPTLKVKRKVVTERFRDQLEALYQE